MKNETVKNIPAEKFEFASRDGAIVDKRLDTKPIGYFKDVWLRFRRNKSSVLAAVVILILILYAIIAPFVGANVYTANPTDTNYLRYGKLLPKSELFAWAGWDGCSNKTMSTANYNYAKAIGVETGYDPIAAIYRANYDDPKSTTGTRYYDVKLDSYYNLGMDYLTLTREEYESIQKWQLENDIQVIFPAVDTSSFKVISFKTDANIWYEINSKGTPVMNNGKYTSLYIKNGNDGDYNSRRIEGDDGSYSYATITGATGSVSYNVRIFKYTYFMYRYGQAPSFLFGTTAYGQDIFTRLASGARFSFIFAICISIINLLIGAVYGAIEGYYGGAADLIMERLSDILSGVPFIVVTTLFQLHLAKQVGPIVALLFAFVLTGWIGMASRVRMQFYRFKGQEYILAARTLGARDGRLMFKHIFPNSLGTLITGSVLVIPGVIFTESSLTYLGIVNLDSATLTSVGTMLANGQPYLSTEPYIIFFPALFIALLEISFNLFGNGLRDAFNPSLRGVEE